MKCKNCGHPKNYHVDHNLSCNALHCACKQFIPFEVLKPTNECQISNHSPQSGLMPVKKIESVSEDKDPDSLKCLDEKGTNTSSGSAFILSDKITHLVYDEPHIQVKHVAEFIRRLKEEIKLNMKCGHRDSFTGLCGLSIAMCDGCSETLDIIYEKIDKLSGSFK